MCVLFLQVDILNTFCFNSLGRNTITKLIWLNIKRLDWNPKKIQNFVS